MTGLSKFRGKLAVLIFLLAMAGASFGQATKDAKPQDSNPTAAPEQEPALQDHKVDDAAAPKNVPMTPAEARQAQIIADTNKLLQLSQELKAEVAKSTKDTLSLAVVKKADEVEKLAKSLKERMKNQ